MLRPQFFIFRFTDFLQSCLTSEEGKKVLLSCPNTEGVKKREKYDGGGKGLINASFFFFIVFVWIISLELVSFSTRF